MAKVRQTLNTFQIKIDSGGLCTFVLTMIWKFLFYIFLFYLAYKLVFDLVIPLYRTTRKIKKGFREMQERMGEQGRQQSSASKPPTDDLKNKVGDYIDFEEVK